MSTGPALSDLRTHISVDASACDLDDLAPCGGVDVKVGGDVDWAEFVQRAVTSSWPGVERLGAQPGTVGDVVRANAEVHGQTVGEVVASVSAWDRTTERTKTFAFAECEFEPGRSRFQEQLPDGQDRYDIREVSFLFEQGDKTAPIRDADLAAKLGIAVGERVPLVEFVSRLGS